MAPGAPIQSFLNMYPKKGTAYAYRTGILAFLNHIYGKQMQGKTATKEEFAKYEQLASKYLKDKKRDRAGDLIDFIGMMNTERYPPKSANIKSCAVRQWMIEADTTFSDKHLQQMRRVKPKGGRRTNIVCADTRILREIIAQGDVRLRAMVLFLASSGCRISEALNVRWSDVRIPDRVKDPGVLTSVFIRDSKTGLSRTTWITREAEEAILAWRTAIPTYLASVTFKGNNLGVTKGDTDDRVFPFARTAAHVLWDNAAKKAGYYRMDESTHRNVIGIHRLRGFFKSRTMGIVGAEVSELLLGHSDAYGNAYRMLSPEQLAEEYKKCEGTLTIASPHARDVQTENTLTALQKENADLQDRLHLLEKKQNLIQTIDVEGFTPEDIQKAMAVLKAMQKAKA